MRKGSKAVVYGNAPPTIFLPNYITNIILLQITNTVACKALQL